MYLTETHLHTVLASPCGHVAPETVVEQYQRAGYTTLVVTDHFKRFCREYYKTESDADWVRHYLASYRAVRDAAGDSLHVLLGMEICFDQNDNDYLVYGPDETDFENLPEMYSWGIQKFHDHAVKQGWLVIQAHPFRNHMTVNAPSCIDGMEVYNGNPRHDSRNDVALYWANKFGLLKTAGSDYHELEDLAMGGLLTPEPVTTVAELQQAIRQGAGLYMKNTL